MKRKIQNNNKKKKKYQDRRVRPGCQRLSSGITKNFYPKILHRILRHMHGVLNIDEKKLIAQFG